MKKCCKETYKKALEQLVWSIKCKQPSTINEIIGALEYAITLLEKNNDEQT